MPKPVDVIAIDGPVAAGKTVVGRMLAQKLGFKYLDTGIMYRAVAWLARYKGVSIDDEAALGELAQSNEICLEGQDSDRVTIDGQVLGPELLDPDISRLASLVAAVPAVRRAMVRQQKKMAEQGKIVMVGRDIGTVVLPDADLKLFLTASVEERARRRWRDLSLQGREVDLEQVLQETRDRDHRDSTRVDSPLVPADDAITINTDKLGIEQAVSLILDRVSAGVGE